MITNLVVLASIVFAAAFAAAWCVRPDLRAWIERPKYRFQDAVRRYDRNRCGKASPKGAHRHE